jgi:4-aminobutyrate aminotransferase-like enzyme
MQAAAPGLLTELREFTRAHGALLVVDEIFTGFGRTGALYGFGHEDVVPDLVVLGKALGGGVPVSLVAGDRSVLSRIPPLRQTSTFAANPVACAAGIAVLDTLLGEHLTDAAAERGARLADGLASASVPGVAVRPCGRGIMLGVRLEPEDPGATAGARFAADTVRALRERGVLALRGGAAGTTIKFTPPLTITPVDVDEVISAFTDALAFTARRQA